MRYCHDKIINIQNVNIPSISQDVIIDLLSYNNRNRIRNFLRYIWYKKQNMLTQQFEQPTFIGIIK